MNFFDVEGSSGIVSRHISELFDLSLPKRKLGQGQVQFAQRFFTKLLEKEYLEVLKLSQRDGITSPEFQNFFIQDNKKRRSDVIGNLDPKASYLAFSESSTLPTSIVEFMRFVVRGGVYREFVGQLPNSRYYSPDASDRWVSNGARFLEVALTMPPQGEIEKYFLNLPSRDLAFVSNRLKEELKILA